ncbi:MAG: hypothetical protein NWF04_02880 [Candidatus Bathyarchaeota archaeon]|nr:hypothetical protein [Candidatus Bathyarchaeota archaeon]
MSKKTFDALLCESIDEVLTILGESVKKTITHHLQHTFNLKPQETPQKPQYFAFALEELLGPGAKYVQTIILKRLYTKIQPHSMPTLTDEPFSQQVKQAAKAYSMQQSDDNA